MSASLSESIVSRSTRVWPNRSTGRCASASSAPCRICAAASLSTASARLARVTSASIIARCTAWVDQRSSHSSIGRPSGARLRAKARTDWVRGLSLPSRLSGRPTTSPAMLSRSMKAVSAARSAVNLVRRMVSAGPGEMPLRRRRWRGRWSWSRHRARRACPHWAAPPRNPWALATITAATPPAAARHRRGSTPRTGHNHRRGNYCRAARRGRAWRIAPSMVRNPPSQCAPTRSRRQRGARQVGGRDQCA